MFWLFLFFPGREGLPHSPRFYSPAQGTAQYSPAQRVRPRAGKSSKDGWQVPPLAQDYRPAETSQEIQTLIRKETVLVIS